ncbi:MAG: TetR/AcrR family transcriptional regulator [Chlorobi bacterium]|nr:TetR/AcrR family transcriptional regulator [Chlorobiota bacterium]
MEETLRKIIETAANLYHKFGIKSVTMDDVAHECMISKKTLYNFVNDKLDLLKHVLEYEYSKHGKKFLGILDEGLNAVEEIFEIQKNLIKMIKNHNPAVEHDLLKYYPIIHRELSEQKSEHVYKMMIQNMKKGINEGLYSDDIDIDLIAKQRVILQVQKIENSVVSYKEFIKPKAVKQMFIYHLRAICSPRGIKLLNEKIKELD